ncbi:hypothetical protein KFK09_023379 [Dendrobium nobile]|uniref:poly(A)-specific ribonuclease n=1 Tax=Dendrobium nobile TaxID=94219 RepID=A0A8T3AM71_DENNO|nr:hypothetical protein KFK09_023379 [Dendrobium nobile]
MWSLDYLDGNFAADPVEIREVWDSNLEEELSLIRSIIADYPFISMNTKFPAFLIPSVVTSPTSFVFNYQNIKSNIDAIKLIQLGLTFFNSSGHLPHFGSPPHPCIWQFNFREFDTTRDIFDRNHMDFLRRSGMDIEKNHLLGVTADRFSELIISSGIMQNNSVQWITFHSYLDLGYLLKTLTRHNLPDSHEGFLRSVLQYFPKIYDIKTLMKLCNNHSPRVLNKVAEDLGLKRVGRYHQTGSDSLLVAAVFRKLKDRFFLRSVERYAGALRGLSLD